MLEIMRFVLLMWCVAASGRAESVEKIGIDYVGTCNEYLSMGWIWGNGSCASELAKQTCLCALPIYVQTSVACIDELLMKSSDFDAVKPIALNTLAVICNVSLDTIKSYYGNSTLLPQVPASTPQTYGTQNATSAFRLDPHELSDALAAHRSNESFEEVTVQYNSALLGYWAGVCLIRGLLYWLSRLIPLFRQRNDGYVTRLVRKNVTQPALIWGYHSQVITVCKWITLQLPTREQSLILLGFFGLNIGILFGVPIQTPNYWYKFKWQTTFCDALGRRSGQMTLIQFPLVVLFAGRNNFLQWLTGWSQDQYVVFHKWIARVILVDMIVHVVTYTIAFVDFDAWGTIWSDPFWNWGVVGFFFLCFLIVQGSHMMRRLSYEIFLVFHIIGVIFFIIGGFYHVKLLECNLEYFYAVWAVWIFDRVLRLVRVIIAKPFANAIIESHDDSTLEMTISYSGWWSFGPGAYFFIHMLPRIWESHPFTVFTDNDGNLKIFCRAKNGITKTVLQRVKKEGGVWKTRVLVDGPYGGFIHDLRPFNEIAFFAGGIGITAPYSFIKDICDKSTRQTVDLYWAIADEEPLEWFASQIEYMRSNDVRIHVYISGRPNDVEPSLDGNAETLTNALHHAHANKDNETTGDQSTGVEVIPESSVDAEKKLIHGPQMTDSTGIIRTYGRMHTEHIVRDAIAGSSGSVAIMCCGPGGINDACRVAVAEYLGSTRNYVEYFEESFSW